jgi:hypothetical protein
MLHRIPGPQLPLTMIGVVCTVSLEWPAWSLMKTLM